MRRRKFIQQATYGGGIVAAACTPYGLARLLSPEQKSNNWEYLKLPGALADDLAFAEACIGCGLCGEVCPPQCIKFNKRQGGNKVNTPYIIAEEKGCILCGKCMDVCPTDALTKVEYYDVNMGIAQIDRTVCYPWVDRGICGACVSVCPLGEKAINFKHWNQYQPVVKDGCVGCGLCVEVCPHPSLPIKIVKRSEGSIADHAI
jgi:ferredoxin